MNSTERKALASLASLYGLRMLGLFMVLPVLVLYVDDIKQATPSLIGLALGIYGVTQAFLQIPLGALSDRIGRKPVIIGGLLLFCLGSIIAANAENVYWLIIGRAIQGSGAIASSVMALLTDLTREEHRTKALATVGMVIGLSFSVSMVLGPFIASFSGLNGIFLTTGALALIGVFIVLFVVPTPNEQTSHADHRWVKGVTRLVFNNRQIWMLTGSVFVLHLSLMCLFVVVPLGLEQVGLKATSHWMVYIPVMIIAFIFMIPMMVVAEKYNKGVLVFKIALSIMIVGILLWMFLSPTNFWWLTPILLYFIAFNFMEAILPSWLSRIAPAGGKGTAMGVFSTMQFLGAAVGGWLGGTILQFYGFTGVFLFLLVLLFVWFIAAYWLTQPVMLSNFSFKTKVTNQQEANMLEKKLLSVEGIEQVYTLLDEQLVCLKVQKNVIDYQQLMDRVQQFEE